MSKIKFKKMRKQVFERPNMSIEPVTAVTPTTYNPRHTDPKRLQLIALSLRKLGFLLPVFADENGEISSGHQRHLTVTDILEWELLPVARLPGQLDLDIRKSINVMFNRATNDMTPADSPADMVEEIRGMDIEELARNVPDVDPGDPQQAFPCMFPEWRNLDGILSHEKNRGRQMQYARNISNQLWNKGVSMDLIIASDGEVLNGLGRARAYAEKGVKDVSCIVVPDGKVELARACLNLITMDFDLKERYQDFLRYSSFRRARVIVPGTDVGYGFTMFVFGDEDPININLNDKATLIKWEQYHGKSILDFGSGRMKETRNLRSLGFDVSSFEPFYAPLGTDVISREETERFARLFLKDVKDGVEWDSLFLSAVLNSVPFYEDRQKVIAILQACFTDRTKGLFVSANSVYSSNWLGVRDNTLGFNKSVSRSASFKVSYEPGTKIGDIAGGKPKVQKFHSAEEFSELLGQFFNLVDSGYYKRNVTKAVARDPKPVDPDFLAKALSFEFNLKYPDGNRLGLHHLAVDAFNTRLDLSMTALDEVGW